MMTTPLLSVVVVVFDMKREAPRTLQSLSASYQVGVDETSYEVIVVDNGSTPPHREGLVAGCGDNFRYHYVEGASPSPAHAMNLGISMARGHHIGLLIDGARIVTPGLIRMAVLGLKMSARPIVTTLAWHLGPKPQMQSTREGYTREVEDALLASVDWPRNGYDLFTIAALAGSSNKGFFQPIAESNALFMTQELVDELGGFDEAFALPGGGVVNLDFYERACALPDTDLVTLLGEGTFHQIHGGVATSAPAGSDYEATAFAEYAALRGRPYQRPNRSSIYLGTVPDQAMPFLVSSLNQ